MKKQFLLSAIAAMAMCLCANAQNVTEGTLILRNGQKVAGQIEMQADGSTKVVTATGDTFFFAASEIANVKSGSEAIVATASGASVTPGMKYPEYKKFYSARSYSRQEGDKYNPGLATALSVLLPGVGEACVGRWGNAAAFGLVDAACFFVAGGMGGFQFNYFSEGHLALVGMVLCRVWSAIDANKVAKIKNLYYRDINGLSSIQFNLEPYVGQIGTLAMQPTPVAGMTLRVSF